MVDNQFAEVDRAVAGLGEYKVSEEYSKFCINPAKWFTMSEDQRQRVLKHFQSILPLNFPTEDDPGVSNSTSINEQSQDSGSTSYSSHSDVNTQSDANLLLFHHTLLILYGSMQESLVRMTVTLLKLQGMVVKLG